ncbi:hypothetical protein EZS27_011029 [termite gut metagenome]|uniref:HNH nuclease domain-containing protein n=1 Tax=termite gut metagenome TaxID=433724 RepID=A0A5J4S6Z7_9ZZZZ
MIKLELPTKPEELTDEVEKQLIAKYKADKTPVWRKEYIKKPLLEMSHDKCAFSEQKLNSQSAYMEVEHFKPKSLYEDEVVRWGNLLPICKKCNAAKGNWDVNQLPIVNPLIDYPRNHLFVRGFRFYKKDEKGKNTIDAVALNDRNHFVDTRLKIGSWIADNLKACFKNQKNDLGNSIEKHETLSMIKKRLKDCGSKEPYSAVLSTYILYELPEYGEMERFLKENNLWDDEFQEIKDSVHNIV